MCGGEGFAAGRRRIAEILRSAGFRAVVADAAAWVLCSADEAGRATHGERLIPLIVKNLQTGRVRPDLHLALRSGIRDVICVECAGTLGYAAAVAACRFGLRVTRRRGSCLLALVNIDHIGALGVYARMGAERGYLTLLTALGRPRVAVPGTNRPVLGTCPIAFGLPATRESVVVDLSVAELTVNRILELQDQGEDLPPGAAVANDGKPTISPEAALAGALLPIGGHKGLALAFALDLLVRGFADTTPDDHAVLVFFTSVDTKFREEVDRRRDEIRAILDRAVRLPGSQYCRRER